MENVKSSRSSLFSKKEKVSSLNLSPEFKYLKKFIKGEDVVAGTSSSRGMYGIDPGSKGTRLVGLTQDYLFGIEDPTDSEKEMFSIPSDFIIVEGSLTDTTQHIMYEAGGEYAYKLNSHIEVQAGKIDFKNPTPQSRVKTGRIYRGRSMSQAPAQGVFLGISNSFSKYDSQAYQTNIIDGIGHSILFKCTESNLAVPTEEEAIINISVRPEEMEHRLVKELKESLMSSKYVWTSIDYGVSIVIKIGDVIVNTESEKIAQHISEDYIADMEEQAEAAIEEAKANGTYEGEKKRELEIKLRFANNLSKRPTGTISTGGTNSSAELVLEGHAVPGKAIQFKQCGTEIEAFITKHINDSILSGRFSLPGLQRKIINFSEAEVLELLQSGLYFEGANVFDFSPLVFEAQYAYGKNFGMDIINRANEKEISLNSLSSIFLLGGLFRETAGKTKVAEGVIDAISEKFPDPNYRTYAENLTPYCNFCNLTSEDVGYGELGEELYNRAWDRIDSLKIEEVNSTEEVAITENKENLENEPKVEDKEEPINIISAVKTEKEEEPIDLLSSIKSSNDDNEDDDDFVLPTESPDTL